MLHDRYCVVHERRGDGRRYWWLYIGNNGQEALMAAVRALRRAYWSGFGSCREFCTAIHRLLEARARQRREARQASVARAKLAALIAMLGIGMFALPTGILGAASVTELQRREPARITCPHCGESFDSRKPSESSDEA